MKRIKFLFTLSMLASAIVLSSCSDVSDDETELIGNWTKSTPFKGRPRSGAISFTIDDVAYVGLGYDGDDYIGDFYQYNITSGFWEARQAFPGMLRERAVAFSINGKGYVGLGYNREEDKEELGDFWEYDPETNQWTQLNDFEGTARYNAVSFAIGSKGYVGTGYDGDSYNSDFWEYNPTTDEWTEIKSYPGEKIEEGTSFVIEDKAYVFGGRNNGLYNNDFWEFDPEAGTWTTRTPDDDESYYDEFVLAVRRHNTVTFTIDMKAYVVGGIASSGAVDNAVYEFDATSFTWTQKTSFEGSARSLAIGFVLDSRAFVTTGQNSSSRFDDMWEFKPKDEYDDTY